MKKALLVIDMQNFCVGVHHSDFFNYNNEELINSVNNKNKNKQFERLRKLGAIIRNS